MPVEFLTDDEARYGRYGERLSRLVLAKLFFLDDDVKVLIGRHRGPHMMLGFALQLVTVRRADAHRPRRLANLGAHVREGPGDPDLWSWLRTGRLREANGHRSPGASGGSA